MRTVNMVWECGGETEIVYVCVFAFRPMFIGCVSVYDTYLLSEKDLTLYADVRANINKNVE